MNDHYAANYHNTLTGEVIVVCSTCAEQPTGEEWQRQYTMSAEENFTCPACKRAYLVQEHEEPTA
jgi:uncharacterized protein YbaR (Trm112 family)